MGAFIRGDGYGCAGKEESGASDPFSAAAKGARVRVSRVLASEAIQPHRGRPRLRETLLVLRGEGQEGEAPTRPLHIDPGSFQNLPPFPSPLPRLLAH